MSNIRTFINADGEVFEGTKSQICKDKGIKHRTALERKGGALDNKYVRWWTEEIFNSLEELPKKKLYLGGRMEYAEFEVDGKKCKKSIYWHPSETAGIYNEISEALDNEESLNIDLDLVEQFYENIFNTYEIVDNKHLLEEQIDVKKVQQYEAYRAIARVGIFNKPFIYLEDNDLMTEEFTYFKEKCKSFIDKYGLFMFEGYPEAQNSIFKDLNSDIRQEFEEVMTSYYLLSENPESIKFDHIRQGIKDKVESSEEKLYKKINDPKRKQLVNNLLDKASKDLMKSNENNRLGIRKKK